MKERGMIFNAEMVRAILNGRKTQTRRVMKSDCMDVCERDDGSLWPWREDEENHGDYWYSCPFGSVGDRIWVRETYGDCGVRLVYRADSDDGAACMVKRWTPSIHMPRSDSRITLEITAVRVERLNDINEADAIAEGLERYNEEGIVYYGPFNHGDCRPEIAFGTLWQSIYGEEAWRANPWVWVIEFKRVEGGAL